MFPVPVVQVGPQFLVAAQQQLDVLAGHGVGRRDAQGAADDTVLGFSFGRRRFFEFLSGRRFRLQKQRHGAGAHQQAGTGAGRHDPCQVPRHRMAGGGFEEYQGIQDGTGLMVGVQGVQVDGQAGQDLVELVPVVYTGIDLSPFTVGTVGRHRQNKHLPPGYEVDGQVHFLDAHAGISAAQQQDDVVDTGVPLHHGRVIRPVIDVETRFRERPDHPVVLFGIGHGVIDDEQAWTAVLLSVRLLTRERLPGGRPPCHRLIRVRRPRA